MNANHTCEICGSEGTLNSHHINGRSPQTLRWNLDNGICLCITCHTFGSVSAHCTSYDGQRKFHVLLEGVRGKKLLDELAAIKGKGVVKYTNKDLTDMLEEMKTHKTGDHC